MKQVLLDTNAYSELLKGDERVLSEIGEAEKVYMSVFVLGELFYGFKGGQKEVQNRGYLKDFLSKHTVRIVQASEETAEYFSELKHNLKMQGKKIPLNDVWIAAHTMQHGAVLITYDRHFEYVQGLRIWKY
jgi:tRNA(fMet)-specific endonuclease VapC